MKEGIRPTGSDRRIIGLAAGLGLLAGAVVATTAHSIGAERGRIQKIYNDAATEEAKKYTLVRTQIRSVKAKFAENDKAWRNPTNPNLQASR